MKKLYVKILLGILFAFAGTGANAQLTGTKNIPGDYATLALALIDLNSQGVGAGGVTLNLLAANPQTAPVGGYIIGGAGSLVLTTTSLGNPVIIQGNSNTITAFTPQAPGSAASSFDAVFKIVGGDYVTIQGFTIEENAGNTVLTPGIANTMTEFGVLLVPVTATDGAQNNTVQNNTITLNAAYTNSVGIFSTSSSSPVNANLDATSTSGTNSNNRFYGNSLSNIAQGILFICPPVTATVFETGNDVGGSSIVTANTVTFGNATASSGPWNRSQSSVQAGIYYRNGAGNNIRFNTVTSTSAAYVGTGGLNGIMISNGSTPTGVTYTSTISDNIVNLTTTGVALITGIDFGHGIATGTIIGSNNNITLNQNSTAANSTVAIGLKANYTNANNTCSSNTVTINQSETTGALSGAPTGITLAGTSSGTITAASNSITINQTGSGTGTITGTATALNVAGTSVNNNVLTNTILVNQTTSVASGITNSILGILATSAASSALNITTNNTITIKQGITAAGTYTSGAVTYASVNGTHNNVNITGNNFNTTGSTIRSTGALDVILGGNSTLAGLLTIKTNTAIIDRVSASGAVGFYTQTSTLPNDPADSISINTISFTNLSGTSSVTVINRLGGGFTATRNICNNIISVTGTNTGNVTGIIYGYSSTVKASANSVTISAACPTVVGISGNSNSGAVNMSNNVISLMSSTVSPTNMTGLSIAGTGAHVISSNSFSALNYTGVITGSPVISAIAVSVGTLATVSNNTINNISVGASASTASPTVDAILISGGNGVSVFKNKIYGITTAATGSSTVVNGIRISGGGSTNANNVYNNLIGDLNTSAATNSDAVRGISITSTSTSTSNNVYYNTIYLSGVGGTNFGASGIFHTISTTPTTSSLNLRNNIIVNNCTPNGTGLSVAFRRSGGAANNLSNYVSTSNNNLFYAGTPGISRLIYSDGTSTAQTIAAYRSGVFTAGTIAPRDAMSVSENTTFLSTAGASANFLHIDPAVATQVESGAATIAGITDDYDADVRNGTTPDIGADEGNFTLSDLAPPVITYTTLAFTCTTGDRALNGVTITDASGVPTSGTLQPRIYFRKNAGAWFSTQGTLATGTGINGTWNFNIVAATMVGLTVGDNVQYYVIAQDIAGTPNVSSNPAAGLVATDVNTVTTPPSSPNAYSISATLIGSYNVGSGQTYTTLTAAITAYNNSCLGGPVTFLLTDAAYTEAGAMIINANADASAVNTLTIKPTLPNTTIAVAGGSAISIITLYAADYVTIDGSISATANTVCPVSTASRDLTITNTSSITSSAVVWLQSNGADGANNNTVMNCNLTGSSPTTGTLIGLGSGSAIGIAATTPNNANRFINNNISKVSLGIVSFGSSALAKNTGTIINQNLMNTAVPDNIGKGGIYAAFEDGILISGNTVSNISGVVSDHAWGITCGLRQTSTNITTGNDVTNASITNNIIGSIRPASTYGVAGIAVASVTSGTNLIANNMIADAFTNGTAGDIGAGIYIGGGAGSTTNIFHNTVQLASTLLGGTYYNFGIAINGADPVVNLKNNIVTNTGSNDANNNRALGFAYPLPATNLSSNYNDFFVSGTSAAIAQTSTLANSGGVPHTTLLNWQTNATQDANSINIAPVFTSVTNLHLIPSSNITINNTGTPVPVNNDIDCDVRDVVTPDMGADEFSPPIDDAGVTAIVLSSPFCPGLQTVQATIKNFGTAILTSVLVDWTVTPGGAQSQVNPVINLAPGASATITLGTFTFASGTTYSITATTSMPNGNTDLNTANDAFTQNSINTGLIGNYNVGSGGDFTTLTAAAAAYNTRALCGAVTFTLTDATYSAGETFPIAFNNNTDASAIKTLTILPNTSVAINGNNASGLLRLNGGRYITVDGRIGAAGSIHSLSITNTLSTGPAVVFINDAGNNTVKYTDLKSDVTTTTSGVVLFSTTIGSNGNDNNTVDNCNIGPNVANPTNGIYSSGTTTTAAQYNSNNTISNNNIFDFYNSTSTSNAGVGVNISSGNTDWTISGNSFYQTATRTTFGNTATFNGILISNININNVAVLNNFIGGSAANCGGTAMTLNTTATLVFRAIQASVGTITPTSIQGNTIRNIDVTTASASTAQSLISAVTGSFNIGNATGNTLGSQSINGSVLFTQSTTSTAPVFSGIIVGTGTPGDINVSNNTIGGITVSNSSTGSVNLRGISINGIVTASTVNNNTVGSAVTANSLNVSNITTASTNTVIGIEVASGIAVANSISGNTVANIGQNSTSSTASNRGISYAGTGLATISGNIVHDISSASTNTTMAGGATAVQGILYTGTSPAGATVSLNEVYAISATNSGAVQTNPVGIGYSNPTNGVITRNKIYDIRNASTITTATTPPMAIGLLLRAWATSVTVTNNMISLGNSQTTNTEFVGVLNNFATSGTINAYYNSVNIEGTASAGSLPSFGFLRGDNGAASSITSPVDIRNNIFNNIRTGGTGNHYAIGNNYGNGTSSAAGWGAGASNYNDLFSVSALTLGYWNTAVNFAGWQTASASATSSINVQPNFVSATDLHLVPSSNCRLDGYGTPIAGFTTDFDAQIRDADAPDMGADEFTTTPAPSTIATASNCDTKNVSTLGTLYVDGSCNLINKVLPSGGSVVAGKIKSCVTIDGTQLEYNGEPYVQRHHDIEPATNAATATATVTLYYTDAEFISYNTLYPAYPPLPTNGLGNTVANRNNVRITQFHGDATTNPSKPGFYSLLVSPVLITPGAANVFWNGNYWEVTFDVVGFSGFYLHTTNTNAPLPVSINYFTGVRQNNNHILNWKVTCNSTPRVTITLERSADARNYDGINTLTADALRCNQPFDYTDTNPLKGMNYYRLKMVDADGKVTYSSIVALLNAVKGFDIVSIAPNPVTNDGNFKLNIASAQSSKMEIIIIDMQGRIVNRQKIAVAAGSNIIPMNAGNLAAGTYTIYGLMDGDKSRVIRFVKQ